MTHDIRIGWVRREKHQSIPCRRANDPAQDCNPEGARYRVIIRGPLASIDGFLCTNHVCRLADAIDFDPHTIGPWIE